MPSGMEVRECTFRIERQVELVFPPEFVPGFAQCVVAYLCPRVSFGQIGRMGGYFISDYSHAYIFFIGQGEVL